VDLESIGTGLAILGASEVAKDSVQKMLAPTADYIGAGLLTSAKASVNLARVLVRAAKRIGRKSDGQIPPRVMKAVLEEAPFVEDEVAAAYMGGILASAYSDRPRDDRAVAHLATIGRLSVYSIKLHYLVYRSFYEIRRQQSTKKHFGVFIPDEAYKDWMQFSASESAGLCLAHSVVNLEREDLMHVPLSGNAESLGNTKNARKIAARGWQWPSNGGVLAGTTILGGELFLWAHGYSEYYYPDLLDMDELSFEIEGAAFPSVAEPVPIAWKTYTR
jgi:hypothetical protein